MTTDAARTLIDHRYEVVRALGVGGMGAVYLAEDRLRDGLPIAVKTILDAGAAHDFEREFRLLCRLRHPNLAAVHDFGFDEATGQHYFTTDYVNGEPFAWAGSGWPFTWLIERTVQLCRALGYVHQEGLLHCDVKPENVLVERASGRVRLLDFGVAMAAPTDSVLPRGTLPFMAPEWIRGATPDPRVDLYGLGMLLFRVTTGRFPFLDDSREAVLRFHLEEIARFPEGLEGVPAWWGALIERLLAKEPDDRLPSIAAVLREINVRTGSAHRLETAETWAERLHGGRWIGRAETVEELRRLVDSAIALPAGAARLGAAEAGADPPVLVAIEGNEGVGKSRLLREIKRGYQLRRVPVVLESGLDDGAFDALLDSVRCQPSRPSDAERAPTTSLSTTPSHNDEPDPRDTRSRRVDEGVDLLLAAATDAPLVILLDDAHTLDGRMLDLISATLHAIDYALTSASDTHRPRLVFVTAAPSGAREDGILAKLALHRLGRRLNLRELKADEVESLLGTLLGDRLLPEGLADEVRAACGGNPAFIQTLLAFLIEHGSLTTDGEALRFSAAHAVALEVPTTMEESLRRIVEALPPNEREVLLLHALAVEPYPTSVLAAASRLTEERFTEAHSRLVARGLVVDDPSREGAPWRPASQTLATVAAASVSDGERVDRHRELLAALDDAPPSVATPAARAGHLEAAGEEERGWRAALDAGHEARLRGSLDVALDWLARANRMAGAAPERLRAIAEEETTVHLLHGTWDHAAATVERVLGESEETLGGAERARWLRRLGDVRSRQGDHDGAAKALAEALLQTPEDDSLLRASIHALHGRVAFFQGNYADARARSERALEVTRDAGRQSMAAARALNTLGLVEAFTGDPNAGLDRLRQAEAIFEALGDNRDLAFLANSLGLVHHRRGDAQAAIEAYERSLRLARELGDHRRETIARMNLSVAYQKSGQVREAIDRYLDSLERAYRIQDRESLMRIANNLGNIYRFLGRLDEAASWLERSIARAQELESTLFLGYNNLILGEVHLLRDEPEAARQRIWEAETLLKRAARTDAWLEARLDQAVWLRHTGDHAGDHAAAERLAIEVAERAATEDLDDHQGRALFEAAWTALESSGDAPTRRALRHALRALALIEERDAPEQVWRVEAALSRAYIRLGHPEEARHHIGRAAAAREALETRIPPEMRPTFFEREDRRALQEQLDAAAARFQTEHPSGESAPAPLSLAGASLVRLLEINKRLNSETRLDRLLNRIMDAVIDLTGAERGFIILQQGGKLNIEVARNIDRETIRKSKLKISHSIAEEVIEQGRPIFTYDAQDDERYRDYVSIHALKLRSIACIPLKDRETVFGAIYMDNRFQASAFDEEHLELLEAFAEQAAVAITNARLHEHNRTILEELKRSRDQVERLNRELERKLVDQTEVLAETRAALTRRQEQLEERHRYGQIIGASAGMRHVYGLIDRVRDIAVPVIIQGDSGTGKELVARAIHYKGKRRKQEFVSINCAAFPEALLESELFGHKRGSFTGADRDKKGLLQVAHRGTLFLDEVGDMSLGMQAKLLRALQEHEVRPVGGHEAIKVDVRIIAASNQDLKALIQTNRFREDLFYRLNVVTIHIPPLRDRRDDIPLLVEHFLDRIAERTGQERRSMSPDAMKVLIGYDWPGNVRELESTVTTASLFASSPELLVADLANKPELMERSLAPPMRDLGDRPLHELEREAIIQALVHTNGNKMAAAKQLGISRRSLYNKLKQYDIKLTKKTTIVR